MSKIKTPISLAQGFGLKGIQLEKAGVLNVSLNADALLFIDPLLLAHSKQAELVIAADRFTQYFINLVKVLRAIKVLDESDVAYRTALNQLTFPEIPGTCLGYGASSIHGSGVGKKMAVRLVATAKQIIDLGVDDPALFLLLPLVEDDVGPDLISDMVTNIVLGDLVSFTQRVSKELAIQLDGHKIAGKEYALPTNPTQGQRTPLLLLPLDVLRDLPVALDWSDVGRVAAENQAIRDRFNAYVAEIWNSKTRESKHEVRRILLSSKEAVTAYLSAVHEAKPVPYDVVADPNGEFVWRTVREYVATEYPMESPLHKKANTLAEVSDVVQKIIEQFKHLIENRGLWRELWTETGKPRREKSAQRLFFAVADSYCEAFNVDISPEVDTGSGEVDFKMSSGYDARVVVEIKLSDNRRLRHGYERQLERYKGAEKTTVGFYIVLEISDLGDRGDQLLVIKQAALKEKVFASEIYFVDGTPQESASVA